MRTNNYDQLLHPELMGEIPLTGRKIASTINRLAHDLAISPEPETKPVSVAFVIRAYNEAEALETLLQDISEQDGSSSPQVVVVDNESSDGTQDVALSYGATLVTVPRCKFTYPVSMNAGMAAVDADVAYMTVAHANLSNYQLQRAIERNFRDEGVAGTFGRTLPGSNISGIEKMIAIASAGYFPDQKATKVSRFEPNNLGLMGATSAAFRKDLWEDFGTFDEAYERGGEDTALAKLFYKAGFTLVDDGLLSVHHTHGLGTIDTMKQWLQWYRTLKGPLPLSQEKLNARREALNSGHTRKI